MALDTRPRSHKRQLITKIAFYCITALHDERFVTGIYYSSLQSQDRHRTLEKYFIHRNCLAPSFYIVTFGSFYLLSLFMYLCLCGTRQVPAIGSHF